MDSKKQDYLCSKCINEGSNVCVNCSTIVSPSGKISKPTQYRCRYGRRKYDLVPIPSHVYDIANSVIAGYEARKKTINYNKCSQKVKERYISLNEIVDEVFDSLEPGLREELLKDMVARQGYKYSDAATFISANAYYRRKRKVIYELAQKLSLI